MSQKQNKSESRRDFLKTAGKFAVYTPPALMIMSKSSHATFTESCGSSCSEENHTSSESGGGWLQDLMKEMT